MPYLNCPNCGLTLYSAAGYATTDACPACACALPGAARRWSLRRGPLSRPRGRRFRLGRGPTAPAAARRVLGELAVPAQTPREKLSLLVTELVTNSVKYAPTSPDDPVEMLVGLSHGGMRVEVSDGGRGFRPAPVGPNRDLTSGWGLYLVDALADRWGVAQDGPTRVWFELLWQPEPPTPQVATPAVYAKTAPAKAALRRLAAPPRQRRSSSMRRGPQGRRQEAVIQEWLRRLKRH